MSAVSHGAGNVVTDTLLKVAVLKTVLSWLVTARPTDTLLESVRLAVPTCAQLVPSAEAYAVISVPHRESRTQLLGAAFSAGPATDVVDPDAVERDWNVKPLAGVIAISAFTAPALDPSRIITPAFAQAFVLDCEVTRARISPSPTSVCETNWKPSAVAAISAPEPLTV